MASKTISVTDETYNLLKLVKLPHESFGDAIKRLCEEKTVLNLMNWMSERSLWEDISESELAELNETINRKSSKFTTQEVSYE